MEEPCQTRVVLDTALPPEIAVGHGTCTILRGAYGDEGHRLRSVSVLVDGAESGLAGASPPNARSWWAIVDLPSVDRLRTVTVELDVRTGIGKSRRSAVGTIDLVPGWRAPMLDYSAAAERTDGSITGALPLRPRTFVCGAAQAPDPEDFRIFVAGLSEQTYENWAGVYRVCDVTRAGLQALRERAASIPQLQIQHLPGESLHTAFAEALARTPADAPYVAVTAGRSSWAPGDLDTLLHRFTPETNVVFGGSGVVVLRRQLLDYVLPLPPLQNGADSPLRWIGQVGDALGAVAGEPPPSSANPRRDFGALLAETAAVRVLQSRCSEFLTPRGRRRLQRTAAGLISSRPRIRPGAIRNGHVPKAAGSN